MKRAALALSVMLSACASTYAANPNDPVDMAAALGDRARAYVGMGELCDGRVAVGHRYTITEVVRAQQARLGLLSGLVNRAYRGAPTDELVDHMQTQMQTHRVTSSQFCDAVVRQASVELELRASDILRMTGEVDALAAARETTRPAYPDTPSFEPDLGYIVWGE